MPGSQSRAALIEQADHEHALLDSVLESLDRCTAAAASPPGAPQATTTPFARVFSVHLDLLQLLICTKSQLRASPGAGEGELPHFMTPPRVQVWRLAANALYRAVLRVSLYWDLACVLSALCAGECRSRWTMPSAPCP